MSVKITVKCIGCNITKEVGEEQKTQPICENCGSLMIAIEARKK